MINILLVLVGGTICTSLNEEGCLGVSDEAGALLADNFLKSDSPYAGLVNIEPTRNLYILSENMTVKNWNAIIDLYKEYVGKKKYDGVIFAHGTDTLAYSAALFSLVLSFVDFPVFFVSANADLKKAGTNGNDNFRVAVECICRKIIPNVYVPYKNISDGKMFLHIASRLRQCEIYSEDFHSVGEFDITNMNEDNYIDYFAALEKRYPASRRRKVADALDFPKLRDCILYIEPYVGINYDAYRYDCFSAVLHGAYHSGTACAQVGSRGGSYDNFSFLHLIDKCLDTENCVDVYFSPSELKPGMYETVSAIGNHAAGGKRVNFLHGYTNEMAYAKLVIAYSLFKNEKDRLEFLYNEYNFEVIK